MSDDPASLANLRDLALPPPISWWPPAIGWWILAAGALAVAIILLVKAVRRYRAAAYRREAERELAAIETAIAADFSGGRHLAGNVSELLKRTALAAFPREEVAGLTGEAWMRFLDRTGRTSAFTSGPARILPSLAVGKTDRVTREELGATIASARLWIRTHRAAAPGS